MIIKPKIYKNICLNTHPEGCFKSVESQIKYVLDKGKINGPKNVLILGASTGYGLASRIVSAFACDASTIGVAYGKKPESSNELGTVGWYNSIAFERLAKETDSFHASIFGDAFADGTKERVVETIKNNTGKVDLIIYSIASPKRFVQDENKMYSSVIKPINESYTFKTLDIRRKELYSATIEPANEEEIYSTVKVMGGEDWELWINKLSEAGVLSEGIKTVAYSYIGPEFTYPIYRHGTLGKAKENLEERVFKINNLLKKYNGNAYVSINKALITRASAVIPAVALYISILYTIMKRKNIHEDCIHQIYRLFSDHLYNNNELLLDNSGRIRIDDYELREDVQKEAKELMLKVDSDNIDQFVDIDGLTNAFLQFHGFNQEGVDYDKEVVLNEWSDYQ